MAEPPTQEEMESAVWVLKNGKAGGVSGIAPEMMESSCEGK